MKYLVVTLFLFLTQNETWGQSVSLDKITIESDSITKMINVRIKVNGVKLDTLNRVKLIGNAQAITKDSTQYVSDWFYSDDYLDNYDDKYTFVFDSIPKLVKRFEKIHGTLRIFQPSEKTNSIIRIKEGKRAFDSNIIGKAINEIKVVPINAIKLRKLSKRRLKFRDYIDEVSSKNYLNKSLFIETLDKYFNHNGQYKQPKNLTDNIVLYIEHSDFKVIDISIIDRENKQIIGSKLNGPKSAIWNFRNFKSGLSNDYKIEVIYENEESINEIHFELLNVDLK